MSPLGRVVLLLTTLMLLMSLCECDPPTTVHITDCLSNKQWLNFHCKSKNDDLGSRVLAPTNSYNSLSILTFGLLHYSTVACIGKVIRNYIGLIFSKPKET